MLKDVYGDRCKLLFMKNRWTLLSQKCFAAYHARVGDFEGIKWHINNEGKEILDSVQEMLGPRNRWDSFFFFVHCIHVIYYL